MKIGLRNKGDVVAGAMFIVIGAIGIYIGWKYPFGTAVRMGPGYLPMVLSAIMIGLGVLVTLRAFVVQELPRGPIKYLPIIFVLGAIGAFGLLIETGGFLAAVFVAAVMSSFAASEVRWVQSLLLGIGLAAACVGVFTYALGLPISVWPR